jgi:hypothetical protein
MKMECSEEVTHAIKNGDARFEVFMGLVITDDLEDRIAFIISAEKSASKTRER